MLFIAILRLFCNAAPKEGCDSKYSVREMQIYIF